MTSALSATLQWWAGTFASHAILRTLVSFTHVGGLVWSAGFALSADYAAIAARADAADTRAVLPARRHQPHRVVIAGLIAVFASGLLLLAADADTYLASRVFWLKMAVIGALLANGMALVRLERVAAITREHRQRFRRASILSAALWLLATLLGAALPNIG